MDTKLFCPPVLVGERIVWLGSGSGLPQGGIVRWIGKLPEMGPDWTVGIELDNPLPYGGIDGTWGNRHLFTCEPKHGLLVPVTKTIKECDLFHWSKENIENSLQYGRGGNELFSKVHPTPLPAVPKPQVLTTPVAPARKLVTRAKTSEEPRPAIRRRKLQQLHLPAEDLHQPAEQPKVPKRKVKSEVNHLLPKIYEAIKENSKSPASSLNDFNTIKSSSSDFHTLRSSPIDFSTLKSSSDDYNTLKSSLSDFNTLKSSFNDFNTLKTCTSGDYSDYQWFDAKDEKQNCINSKICSCDEPVKLNVHRQCNVIEGQQIRIVQEKCCKRIEVKTPNHGDVHIERMSKFSVHTKCDLQDDDSSYEDAAATVDGLYSDQFGQHFSDKSNTDSVSRREKTASGFFSFLRWFRKGKDDSDDEDEETRKQVVKGLAAATVPSSPELIRSTSSSCGSIDTLFSTATVNSFAFVTPTAYRPFGSANQPEKRIAVGPDTDTYRHRLHQRDRLRELDRNLTLKRKYNLFGSETQLKSGVNTPLSSPLVERRNKEPVTQDDNQVTSSQTSTPGSRNSTFGKKKRKAPDPPDLPKNEFSDSSLPDFLNKCRPKSNSMDNGDPVVVKRSRHRRTVSESAKDKKAGAYCHVKGKRKAPQPPFQTAEQQGGSTLERFCNQISSLGRKKRPAPQPPDNNNRKRESQSYQERSKSAVSQLSPEEKERLIANIAKLKAHAERKSMFVSSTSTGNMDLGLRSSTDQVVCNDSLKLERGVLKPNKELPKVDASTSETKAAPVSPRPWYKRSLTSKDGLGGFKRDIFKSLEKKKDKEKEKNEDWMPEVGIPRVVGTGIPSDGNSCSSTSSRFNIFSRLDRSDDKKKEGEKRKSQISMLANISELDREAAEIVQKEQAREQALMAAQDAKFYSYPDVPMMGMVDSGLRDEVVNENVEVPKRSSARELISLFNAIGNVTKVTVNTTFFSKEGSRFFSKEGNEKRFSFMGESIQTTEQRVVIDEKGFEQQETKQTKQSFVVDSKNPSVSSPSAQKRTVAAESSERTRITGTSDLPSTSSSVTIEEIEDDLEKSSRSRAMYEANKSRRHHSPSPSIPTIAEQSESASSVATTPASTLGPHPGSNRNSGNIPPDVIVYPLKVATAEESESGKGPEALQHAKRITIWSCPRCTLENPRWKITCDACGRWRPTNTEEKVDAAKCDEPFQRPTSPIHDVKKPATNKIQIIKMELSKKGKSIDWEEELKRYLPRDDTKRAEKSSEHSYNKPEVKDLEGAQVPIENALSVDSNSKKEKVTPIENTHEDTKKGILANKTKAMDQPSTFIGGRTKQDKEKDANKYKEDDPGTDSGVMVNGVLGKEPDVDEVRKARLAFFNKTEDADNQVDTIRGSNEDSDGSALTTKQTKNQMVNGETLISDVNVMKKQVDENEQQKLREMLKEMKNSLPKRPKKVPLGAGKSKDAAVVNGLSTDSAKENEMSENKAAKSGINIQDSARKLGAIKKVPQKVTKYDENNINVSGLDSSHKVDQDSKSQPINDNVNQSETAEAFFITKKTVYEDIKVKKGNGPKPMKVSTSVQTSSVMCKIEPSIPESELSKNSEKKPPSGKSSDMVPVTVEEFSTSGIKDGVLYTSLNKESRRIGTGTFELIRARDFANIEATKTGGESAAVHVYANVPSSPTGSSQENNSNMLKDDVSANVTQPVFPLQQSASASVQQPSKSSENKKDVSEPEEIRTKPKERDDQISQGAEKKSVLSDESSLATSSITSPDSESNRGETRRSSRATSETSSYSVASISSGDYSEVERLTAQLTLPKGIADFKADLQAASPEQNMNTLAINRLLRRLEAAIAGGQHNQAAVLAKDLARLKISCSVTRQRRSLDASPASIMVEMYVEDKVSHQGPIPLQVIPNMTVAQLKQKVEQEFEIPVGVQRWILGKLLASDDTKTLQDHNVSSNGCPMFLYLVAPDGEQEGDTVGVSGSAEKHDVTETAADTPGPPPPQPERPGGWYYNDEEDKYSFCEDTESEVTDDEEEDEIREHPTKEANIPAKTEKENKEIEVDDDEEDDEEDDDDNDDDGKVGATAVVIHEKPVVLQAPLVGRPFVKQSPQFVKTVTGQQAPAVNYQEKPSSSQTSQHRRPATPQHHRPDDAHEKPSTSQVIQPTKIVQGHQSPRPSEEMRHAADKPTAGEKKSGTLKLGWKCPACTLVNSPTRPGCAACTTERPLRYVVPVEYRANEQELQRMKHEQQGDNDLQQVAAQEKRQQEEKQHQHYLQLVNLDKTDLVPNVEPFECSICIVQYEPGEGVVLRECLHVFCRTCLANTVQFNEEAEVKCPYRDADYACNSVLQEREIKALVPADIYEQHLAKSVTQAENKIGNAFHCKTPDCRGWCIFEDNVNEFRCPVCRRTNCLTCQAIHDGMNCKQYQEQVKQESETNAEARRTKEMLEEMVVRGEAMNCPTCQVVLMKKWGCDWLRCSMCKTEICWVTRGPRWGPGGKGDTTGGCQCGLNGVKCHPKCNYCH